MATNHDERIGTKHNRLTVMSIHHHDKRNRWHYVCKCDCGKEKVVQWSLLTSGNTKSCGCLGHELRKNKRISKTHSEVTAVILGYKRHALDRGFSWSLDRRFVEELIKKNCHYCGSKPSNIKTTKNTIDTGLAYSGIDRIDSSKGYEPNNVVPCCKICNFAKSNLSLQDFHSWALKIGENAMASQWGV